MAMLVVAGSAFAAPARVTDNATFATGAPTTTNNDDSCDIAVTPAATLLLPYFEVNLAGGGGGETTLFTVTNTSRLPQIAHVTVWTDWSFPVLDFNIFLTGYDTQSINMYDIIGRGLIAPDTGTSSATTPGSLSAKNNANPLLNIGNCADLAKEIPPPLREDLVSALTLGTTDECDDIGDVHANAIGYVTVDVASNCSTSLPTDENYFATEILFDNVLIGDYQQVDPANDFAQGNPMVHIRAVPEGGAAIATPGTNFDRTFYSRYQAGGTRDRRQPLPAVFAARWISGGSTGFATSYKIWREGDPDASTGSCATTDYSANGDLGVTEIVRFDEQENPTTFRPNIIISPPVINNVSMPETSLQNTAGSNFPPIGTGDVAGWMYLNLDNRLLGQGTASQNWVVVSMRAEGRYSVDFDAAYLGNGCSAPMAASDPATNPIGPLPNVTP
jgi:hypothetical protein